MMKKTKGQLETKISEAIIQFEKEFLGRGPLEAKTYLIEDMILVRLKGVLTKAEYQLAKAGKNDDRGRRLVKQIRIELLEKGRPLLENLIKETTGKKLVGLHTDVSTISGERVIIFILDTPLNPR